MSNDQALQSLVIDELAWDPKFDAAHIGVVAKDGVVTLTGFVESFAAKRDAEQAAGRVRGVKAIAEEIEVRLPNDRRRSDDEIAGRAVDILTWDTQIPHEKLRVKVEHGVVTLTGDVGFQYQKAEAETDVRRLNGVRGVVNLIRVLPMPGTSAKPDVVQGKIEQALRRNAEVEASHIRVDVQNGKVTLRGHVQGWQERHVAENAAWAAPGVVEVVDELRIEP